MDSLFAAFAAQAERTPDQIVLEQPCCTTYRDLLADALGIGRQIRTVLGDLPQSVAILASHGTGSVRGLLGVWAAGQIAVPVDPQSNPAVLGEKLAHSLAAAIVCDSSDHELATHLACGQVHVINIDDCPAAKGAAHRQLEAKVLPQQQDLAAIVYTSGSSGRPKGVVHTHASLAANVAGHVGILGLGPGDRELLVAKLTTISGLTDSLRTLLSGGTLVPFDLGMGGLPGLIQAIAAHRPTIMHLVPTIFRRLTARVSVADYCRVFGSVRVLHLGGEPVTHRDFETYQHCFPTGCLLLHNLGCTEVPSFRQSLLDQSSRPPNGPLPLERAAHTKIVELMHPESSEVVTAASNQAEITVRTTHAAIGYWCDDELTSRVFETLASGETRYRTGDLGEWTGTGALIHRGRLDEDVKVLGRRVNLLHVESALHAHPEIDEVAVVAVATDGYTRLVACCVSEPSLDEAELQAFVARELEPWQIPGIVRMDELPTLPSGKVDRSALRRLLGGRSLPADTRQGNSLNPAEQQLAQLWTQVLGIEVRAADASFFELGADSLHAVELLTVIERQFGRRLTWADMRTHATVRQMASQLARSSRRGGRYVEVLREGPDPIIVVGYVKTAESILKRLTTSHGLILLQIPGLHEPAIRFRSIRRSIHLYLSELAAINVVNPSAIVGFSYGGLLAHALAVALWQSGARPRVTMMIEPSAPSCRRRKPVDTDSDQGSPLDSKAGIGGGPTATRARSWIDRLHLRGWRHVLRSTPELLAQMLGRHASTDRKWELFRPVMRVNRRMYGGRPYAGNAVLVGSSPYLSADLSIWRHLVTGRLEALSLGSVRDHHACTRSPVEEIWTEQLFQRLTTAEAPRPESFPSLESIASTR